MHTAYREFTVSDGKAILCSGEVRYTFTVNPGRPVVTANATGGFSPAEGPVVNVTEVAVRFHKSHTWARADSFAWHMLIGDVPDAWFLEQIEEAA